MRTNFMFVTFLLVASLCLVTPRLMEAQNQSRAIDSCALLTKAEVQKILGDSLNEPQKGPMNPINDANAIVSQCTFESSEGSTLTMTVRDSKKGDNSPGYAKQTIIDSGMKVEDVSGLGDAAFWTLGVNQLQAFKGKNIQIAISVSGFTNPKEKAIEVARKALEKF